MDHFCPWMNNAIGAKNQKHFLLFLVYSDIAAGLMYGYLALQLVMRLFLTVKLSFDNCLFSKLVPRYTQLLPDTLGLQELTGTPLLLARLSVAVLSFILTFLSSMVANQAYGLAVGMGTIDRCRDFYYSCLLLAHAIRVSG